MKVIFNREKTEHYNIEPILSLNADYNIIYGEKANGKSYGVKEKVMLKRFLEHGEESVLVRRYDSEITREKTELYWSDIDIADISGGEYNTIYIYNKGYYAAKMVDGKKQKSKRMGYCRALNLAQSYSGTQYPNVTSILLEEFVSLDGYYLPNELFLFNHILSTVMRRRDLKVFLLGNSISRLCPYWREYGVEDIIDNQKQGTIHLIERETDNGKQTVAVEYCTNTVNQSRMFASNRAGMINNGKWLAVQQPHLLYPRDEYECIYCFVVEVDRRRYLAEYLCRGDCYLVYVTPKTTDVKKGTRVISDKYSEDPLHTRGLIPLNVAERKVFDLFYQGKVFFCDNATGTEFNEALKNIKRIIT